MVPCGISGVTMTSMERELRAPVSLAAVSEQVITAFERRFALQVASPARH
jgi:lipoate-protein ligase B